MPQKPSRSQIDIYSSFYTIVYLYSKCIIICRYLFAKCRRTGECYFSEHLFAVYYKSDRTCGKKNNRKPRDSIIYISEIILTTEPVYSVKTRAFLFHSSFCSSYNVLLQATCWCCCPLRGVSKVKPRINNNIIKINPYLYTMSESERTVFSWTNNYSDWSLIFIYLQKRVQYIDTTIIFC